jgi:hypothetical protein
MNGHGEKLSRKQEQAIAALLEQPTIKAAAKSVTIGEGTLRTWLKHPDFQTAYRCARAQLLEQAAGRLSDASGEAVKTLRQLLSAEAETVRLGAARAILELSTKVMGQSQFNAQVNLNVNEDPFQSVRELAEQFRPLLGGHGNSLCELSKEHPRKPLHPPDANGKATRGPAL